MSSHKELALQIFKDARLIPLRPLSKIPDPKCKWSEDVKYNLEEFPGLTSYGIDAGRSGLVIIDCDAKADIDGVESFLELIKENEPLPETVIVETPNSGLHYYFKASPQYTIKNSAGTKLGPSIDVRAEGGYTVGPGSIVNNKDGVPTEYRLYDDEVTEIAMIPDWLAEKIADSKNKTKTRGKNSSEDPTPLTDEQIASRRDALIWAKAKMEDARKGNRDTILNKLSYTLGCVRVDEEEARVLVEIAKDKGFSDREANFKFTHGYQSGLEEDEQLFESASKAYNSDTNTSFKEDPMDSGFYSHLSLAFNYAKPYQDLILWWVEDKKWRVYSPEEGRWVITDETIIIDMIDKFLEELVLTIRKTYAKIPISIYKLQEKLWQRGTVEAVVTYARRALMRTELEIFDTDPDLLNCLNGVVNLKTGELLPHSPSYMFTKVIDLKYVPGAKDEYCDAIISSIHPDERDYMQLMAGQSLTGYQPRSQTALFLHGRGSNGKTTFIDLLLKTSGMYGRMQTPAVFADERNGGDKYALAEFEGLRCSVVEELPDSKALSSGALKRVVGTTRINCRRIYGSFRDFLNISTVFISCNKLPMVTETDDGTWRRVMVITFPYSYKKSKNDCKTKWDRLGQPKVLHAAQNKRSTAEAFLAWRIEGAVRWYADERAEYTVPQSIIDKTDDWRSNNDLMRAWAYEELEGDLNSVILLEDLRVAFNQSLSSKGHPPVTQRHFMDMFSNCSFYHENNLSHERNRRIPTSSTRSLPRHVHDYSPKPSNGTCTYVRGLKFKI